MLDLDRIWQRAQEHFDQRPEVDMRAHAEAVVRRVRELKAMDEPGEEAIAVPAAILHDVGIPRALRLHPHAGVTGQEVESAVIDRDILAELGAPPAQLEAICGIIGIHHHRPAHATAEFKLVYDADLLVNLAESPRAVCDPACDFYTRSASELAQAMLSEESR